MKKKIVIIGPAYPFRGGIASFNQRLALELQDEGYEVIIYTFSLQYPDFLFPGKTQYSEDPPPAELKIHVKINSVNPFNWIEIGREIRDLEVDLVIGRFWLPFMGPCFGTILQIVRRNKKSQILGFVDNIIPHEKRIGDYIFAKYFVAACDSFLVMSNSVKDQLRKFTTQKRIAFAEHPVYDIYGKAIDKKVALQHLNLSEDFQYCLFFGFIRDYKGLDLLLHAFSDERIRNMKIKLIIAGEYYSNEAKYESLIDQLKIRDQLIIHTHFISNEEVKYYFCAADLVTQPYKTATQSGVSSLAYFFEKPMVVTKVGGLPEIVAHDRAGYVVDVKPLAIADAIVDYFQKNKEAEFVKQVQIDKEMFSWERMVREIEKVANLT